MPSIFYFEVVMSHARIFLYSAQNYVIITEENCFGGFLKIPVNFDMELVSSP